MKCHPVLLHKLQKTQPWSETRSGSFTTLTNTGSVLRGGQILTQRLKDTYKHNCCVWNPCVWRKMWRKSWEVCVCLMWFNVIQWPTWKKKDTRTSDQCCQLCPLRTKPNVQNFKHSIKPLLLQQQQLKSYPKTADRHAWTKRSLKCWEIADFRCVK